LLKPKGYFRYTTSSSGKKYQPKINQVNTKVLVEILTPEEIVEQMLLTEASTSERAINIEIDPFDAQNNLNKRSSSILAIVTFLSTRSSPETKVSIIRNLEEHTCWHRGRPRVQCYNNAPTKP
jgi:hypothetical protein